MAERLLFKFYRSYYDVASQLSDKDRLAFYDALMTRQFTGLAPKLTGMANFAYISQKHSIDAQVKGWEDKMDTQLSDNHPSVGGTEGGSVGGSVPPTTQEKEKVKEKEEVKEKVIIPTYEDFEIYAKTNDQFVDTYKLKLKYDAWVTNGWRDGHDKPIKLWRSKLLQTLQYIRKDKQEINGISNIRKL